ncbi:MAG TPA: hypothetical protein VFA32_25410, partial [Dehalococcoidia bacterium]|nr:hypothetical protein [Dehalococcoidia bacterium]
VKHMHDTLAAWELVGVSFQSLRERFDTSTALGRLLLNLLASLAHFASNRSRVAFHLSESKFPAGVLASSIPSTTVPLDVSSGDGGGMLGPSSGADASRGTSRRFGLEVVSWPTGGGPKADGFPGQ